MKVIIDVDTGIDDAMALMLLLSRPDVDVLAATCVRGNIPIDKVVINTFRVLQLLGKQSVPVYKGAEGPILTNENYACRFHGIDGLGDVTWSETESVDVSRLESEHAVMAILRLVNKYPGEITLIALGPLTNIAMAIRLDPQLGEKLKNVYIMGGNIEGRGNVTISSEFNFHVDPEAAHICLNSIHVPLTIIPWEVCVQISNKIPWSVYDKWVTLDTPNAKFVQKITRHWIDKLNLRVNDSGFRSCDLFAMVTVLDRDSILESKEEYATVELHGGLTRGQMVVDWRNIDGRKPNVNIAMEICVDKIKELVWQMLT